MKKLIVFLFTFFLIVLAGCSVLPEEYPSGSQPQTLAPSGTTSTADSKESLQDIVDDAIAESKDKQKEEAARIARYQVEVLTSRTPNDREVALAKEQIAQKKPLLDMSNDAISFCKREAEAALSEFLVDFPSDDYMVFDPVTSYFKLTGIQKPDASPEECQKVWEENIKAGATENEKSTGAKLKFVEGLIPKLRRPCLIFYDEVTVAQNPGLMAALNTLMDDQRVFTLTSGEVVHRHPKTVMTFAGNFGNVEGCREPNRAWQDRCAEIIDIVPPSTEQLKGQLIAMTGWDEVKNANIPIDTFVSILPELAEISEEYYGTCSVRGVAAWLAKAMGGWDDACRGGSFACGKAFEMYPAALNLHLADLQATYQKEESACK